jgi:hypothetical protein
MEVGHQNDAPETKTGLCFLEDCQKILESLQLQIGIGFLRWNIFARLLKGVDSISLVAG